MLGGPGPAGMTGPPVETPKVQCSICQKSGGSPIGDRVAAGPGDGVCEGVPPPQSTPSPVPSRLEVWGAS